MIRFLGEIESACYNILLCKTTKKILIGSAKKFELEVLLIWSTSRVVHYNLSLTYDKDAMAKVFDVPYISVNNIDCRAARRH